MPFQLRSGITFSMNCQTAWDLMMPKSTIVTRQIPPKTRNWCNMALTLARALGDIFMTGFYIHLRLRARALWNTTFPICMGKVGGYNPLTHYGWDKMVAIFQTTFSNEFSWMKMYYHGLKFHWNVLLGVQTGAKPLSEPMMINVLTHMCVTRPQWINKCAILSKCDFNFWRCLLSMK